MMTWTQARIARLTQLWQDGVSASGIAEALGGTSRSAVLGKLHRLKLLKSRQAASAPRRYAETAVIPVGVAPPPALGAARKTPPQPPRSPWKTSAFRPLAGTAPRPWLSRVAGECAFPVGGEGEALVACCAPARAGGSYCARHHAVVFRPAPAVAAPADPLAEPTTGRWAA